MGKHGGSRANTGGSRPGSGPKRTLPHETLHTGLHWHCVRTDYGMEHVADIELRMAGFQVFNPTLASLPLSAVISGGTPVLQPLFDRYVFVRFDRAVPTWRTISRMRGVDGLLGTGLATPAIMPSVELDRLRGQCSANDCIYLPEGVEPGSGVRIKGGQFAGWEGVATWSNAKRVRVLLSVLGGEITAQVPRDQLVVL